MAVVGATVHYPYQVFLSFRGRDTRSAFVDHLYTALVGAGIRTFKDDDELEKGENISSELHKAIQESKIAVVVFSKTYASSSWCLDVLVKILEQKNTNGHMVLPVFYHVNPSQAKKLMGIKAERGGIELEDMTRIEKWKVALREVAKLAGMVLQDEHEAKFIQKVVTVVKDKLSRTSLSVGTYIVGINSHIKKISFWLLDGTTDTNIMVICGIGGIGKTTIAKLAYNLHFEAFEGSSFLANIREVSLQPNGLVQLQRQLLSDIQKRKRDKIWNVDQGIMKIIDAVRCKRVLIVLDDVDQLELLDAILGMRDWFHPGSKIIITTRKKQLLKAHEAYLVHEVGKMDNEHSFELFNWHAFGQDHSFDGYFELSKMLVSYCGGLPLALQVLGSSLSGKTVDVWESTIKKLEDIPDSQILKKIKISYDSLQDNHDKNLFLDITCFFTGKDIDFVTTILDGCGFYTKVGLQNLTDRFLLTINGNKLEMHQLIQEMGREIIRQESFKNPGERSRLWRHKDVFDVLQEMTGSGKIEGLALNLSLSMEDKPVSVSNWKGQCSEDFVDKSALQCEGNSSKRRRLGFFSWLPLWGTSKKEFSRTDEFGLQTAAFSPMHKLRLLGLYNVQLSGAYKEFPKKLKWLFWHGFLLKSIPNDFSLESLVVLEMPYSNLEQLWKKNRLLRSLKILNLSHSYCLTRTPDFSTVPNLEKVILNDCLNLVEVDESIEILRQLVLLNLRDCKSIWRLPQNICKLKSLEMLDLSGCSKLKELPAELMKMGSLSVLRADGINLLHSTATEIKGWQSTWPLVSKLTTNPKFSLTSLLALSLTVLSLKGCNIYDHDIPRQLSNLSKVRRLDLSKNPICTQPKCIKCFAILNYLGLRSINLQSIGEHQMWYSWFGKNRSKSLEIVPDALLGCMLFKLDIPQRENIDGIHGFFKLEPIRKVSRQALENLGWEELEYMECRKVKFCNLWSSVLKLDPQQGLYECGIFSVFLPGSEIPKWFKNNKKMDFSINGLLLLSPVEWPFSTLKISFRVPSSSLPNPRIQGLNICVVYQSYPNQRYAIVIRNMTKGLQWTSQTVNEGCCSENDESDKHMIWLSHWKIKGEFELQGGDDVAVILCSQNEPDSETRKVELQLVYSRYELACRPT